jgi:acyl-CoA synthetase (AMP-forming)/AMP-acid ligase II
MQPAAPDEIGEIWVSGPNVAQGYWNQPETTAGIFHARLAAKPETRFLRTGDLGFIHDEHLFITGRLKDQIIIAGRNLHPDDIEQTMERSHPAVRAGGCAAFPVEIEDEERLVVAAELERTSRACASDEITQSIRRSVAEQHGVSVHAVALLRPAGCPRTTSGKIMRHACRSAFLDGTLKLWSQP